MAVVLGLERWFISVYTAFWYGFVLGGSKPVYFRRWQVVLLSWLVLLIGVKLPFTLVTVLDLLVPVLGICAVLLVVTSGVKIA